MLTIGLASTAFAAGWQQNAAGYWYGTNDDNSTWYSDGWQWIDGNQDGIAECYDFGPDGYIYTNTVTPDGYTVNADGAWVIDGVVQTQQVAAPAQQEETASASSETQDSAAVSSSTGSTTAEAYYVLNLNSKKFHRPDRPSVDRMKESNKKIVTESREQIISEGYDPCKNCNP